MWIRERFSDTSRSRERRGLRATSALVSVAAALAIGGCLVTDKIEFQDRVNMPISIEAYQPPNDRPISAYGLEKKTFSVTVWDPDIDDVDDPKMRGKLVVHSDYMGGTTSDECRNPRYDDTSIDEDYFEISCSFTVPDVKSETGLIGTDIVIELVVSDQGFNLDENPKEGAEVSRITWTLRVEEE